ncbi:MAG: hypothetical protein WD377_03970 [Nitriliruptoraceae bacterium]
MWPVSRVIAFGAVAFLTWQYGLGGLGFGIVFVLLLPWVVRLRRTRRRSAEQPPNPPQLLHWRPRVRLYGLVASVLATVGGALLLQQYQVSLFDRATLIRALVIGVASGVLVPSVFWWFTVAAHNRRLAKFGYATPHTRGSATAATALMRVVIIAAVSIGVTGIVAVPALADLNGPCSLAVNGQSVDARDRDDVISVAEGGALAYSFSAPSDEMSGSLGVYFAGVEVFGVAGDGEPRAEDSSGPTTDSGAIGVDALAIMGAGLYEVRMDLVFPNGERCTGGFVFGLPGDPLDNPIGATAATMTAMGVIGLAAGAAREAAETLGQLDRIPTRSGGGSTDQLHGHAALDALRDAGRQTVEVGGETLVVASADDLPGIGLEASSGDATMTVEIDGEPVEVYRPDADVAVVRTTTVGERPAVSPDGPPAADASSGTGTATELRPGDAQTTIANQQPEPEPLAPPAGEPVAGADAPPAVTRPDPLDGVPDPVPPAPAVPPTEVVETTPVADPAAPPPSNATPPPAPVSPAAAGAVAGADAADAPPPTDTIDAAADGSDDFAGTGASRWLSDTAQTLLDARDKLTGWVDELFGEDDATAIKNELHTEEIGDTLGTIKETADAYTHFVEVGTETIDTLDQWDVPPRMQEAVVWYRWMAEAGGRLFQPFADSIATPMMEPIAKLTGGDAGEYAQAWLPVQETSEEASRAMLKAVKYVRGGQDRVGQIQDNFDVLEGLYDFP